MKIKSWEAQKLGGRVLLLTLLIGHNGCVLFFKVLILLMGKWASFFNASLVIKCLLHWCVNSTFCSLEPPRGRQHYSSGLGKKKKASEMTLAVSRRAHSWKGLLSGCGFRVPEHERFFFCSSDDYTIDFSSEWFLLWTQRHILGIGNMQNLSWRLLQEAP